MSELNLKSAQFRQEREGSWRGLEALLRQVESRGLRSLAYHEVSLLVTLYRGTLGSLSVARAVSLDRNLLDYLSSLAGRAHLVVHAGGRGAREAVIDFAARRFPAAVRSVGLHVAFALLCLGAGVLCGWTMTADDMERYYSFVPSEMAADRTPDAGTEALRRPLFEGDESPAGALHLFATFLFSHNAKMGMLCFALGFAAGAPTVVLLFWNGLALGAMAALYSSRGLGVSFWAWLLPHAVTELLAVALCGAAGLACGAALVFPGRLGRLDSAARRGKLAAVVVIGAVVMFFLAALIEGIFRQLVQDERVRWAVAGSTLLLWAGYLLLAGRGTVDADRRP